MASLTDIKGLAENLVAKAQEVQEEVDSGDVDFARLVRLTDEVGMAADKLAALFATVNEAFAARLDSPAEDSGDLSEDLKPSRSGRSSGNGSRSVDESSREELYERAKRMNVPGRSEMTKDELAKAVRGRGRAKAGS
jgi:hypothetical protein